MKNTKKWMYKPLLLLLGYVVLYSGDICSTGRLIRVNISKPDLNVTILGDQPIPLAGNIAVNIPLPVKIKVVDENNRVWYIHIQRVDQASSEKKCNEQTSPIVAFISELEDGSTSVSEPAKQYACITTAASSEGKGDLWRSLALFIAENDAYQQDSKMPTFKIGINAWVTNKMSWGGDVPYIEDVPNDPAGAQAFTFKKHEDTFQKIKGNYGLFVLQGQQAWGGSSGRTMPLYGMVAIQHVYNNTPYFIKISRNLAIIGEYKKSLGSMNFTKVMPPYTAIPFALAFLPGVATEDDIENLNNCIKFSVVAEKEKMLPQAFEGFTSIEGTEVTSESKLSREAFDEMSKSIAIGVSNIDDPQDVSGYKKFVEELTYKPDRKFMLGKYIYSMFALPGQGSNKTICFRKHLLEGFDATGKEQRHVTVGKLNTVMYTPLNKRLLRLIINAKNDRYDLLELRVENMTFENPWKLK